MLGELDHLFCEGRLRKVGLFSLVKRRLQVDLRAAFQYLKGSHRGAGLGLLTESWSDRMKGDDFKPEQAGFI